MRENALISLGHITKAQGLKGAFRVRAHGVESENMLSLKTLYIHRNNGQTEPYSIKSIQQRKGFFVVILAKITHIDQVTPLINNEVFADQDEFSQLDDGDYYWYELIGLKVQTKKGRDLGEVKSIIPTGSNDVLQVVQGKHEYLIPYTEQIVSEVNLETGTITIDPIPGLLD